MPKTIIAGKNGYTFQGNIFTWDPKSGLKVDSSYKGPIGVTLPLSGQLANAGIPHNYSESAGVATVTLTGAPSSVLGSNEIPSDGWQLLQEEGVKDIYESDIALSIEDAKRGSLGAIRNDVVLFNQGKPGTINTTGGFQITGTALTSANTLVDLIMRGTTHFPCNQPVLRHTQVVSESYNGTGFSLVNQGLLYSHDQLLNECAGFPRKLPDIYINQINALITPTARNGYLWSWRKKYVNYETCAQYQVQVVTEYHLDQWSTNLFHTW